MNYVTTKVVCNTENIYIPLQSNAKVMLATAEEINYALGLNDIRNPLVCGYLEMYEGTKGCEKVTLPANLNSKFIIGPEGAHLNISGISGLASKTSYAMVVSNCKKQIPNHAKTPSLQGLRSPGFLKGRISIIFIFCSIKGGGSLTLHSLAHDSDFIHIY